MTVTDRHTPKHRANGAAPSRHLVEKGTLPQHKAEFLIKLHGGSLTTLRTRRAAQ